MNSSLPTYNWTDRIGYFYSEFFALIYPYFHNHFVSYLLILICGLAILWGCYRSFKRTRVSGAKWVFGVIGAVVASFVIWFVVFHFHTYINADMFFDETRSHL